MKSGSKTWILGLAIIALLGVFDTEGGIRGDRSHIDANCQSCHLAQSEINQQNAGKLVASQEILCGRCHEAAVVASHPSGIPASMKVPDSFPLDWKGDVTCSTCHEVHGRTAGLMRVQETGRAYCGNCHDDKYFAAMKDGGSSLLPFGHIAADDMGPGRGLDPYSMNCIECHEREAGSLAVRIDGALLRHSRGSMNHPIGVAYDEAALYGGYRKRQLVDVKLLMPGGRLSCLSCHEGYNADHGKLAVSSQRLCFECHDL